MNYFNTLYRKHWQGIIDDKEICHVESRCAQVIMKYDIVELIRQRDIKRDTLPYKFKKAVFCLLP